MVDELLLSDIPPAGHPDEDAFLMEVLHQTRGDIEFHCRAFHPERFSRPFSPNHHRFFEVYNDETVQKVLLIAHRGWGKTSLINFGIPSHRIVHDLSKVIVPTSATSTSAIMQSENLRQELVTNPRFTGIMGEIKSDTFGKELWRTSNGVTVFPRSTEQQIRGTIFGNNRIDLLIGDDLETLEAVCNEDRRKKIKQWFFTDFMNSVDRSLNNWRILIIGTILHEASLLQDLRQDSSWTVLEFPLCDPDMKVIWTQFMPQERVDKLVEEYKQQGCIEDFYLEYMNIANPRSEAVFRPEYFRYYNEEVENLNRTGDNVVIVDPTKSEKPHSAYSAIIGGAVRGNSIFYRDTVNERLTADDLYERAVEMALRINASVIGIEVTGLNEFITKPFQDYINKRGLSFQVVELKARRGVGEYSTRTKGKAGRIAALAPYYRMGHIYHNPATCKTLELQLLEFPKARYIDLADAASYIIELTDIGGRFFDTDLSDEPDSDEEHDLQRLMEEDEIWDAQEPYYPEVSVI